LGCALGSAFGLETLGQSPNRGRSPIEEINTYRQGVALPQIGRQSRGAKSEILSA